MPRLTVNGVDLSYQDEGSGRPLLLLHGWSMSGRFFQRQVESLVSTYRVIVPDFRGHGESEKVTSGHTVEQYAKDIRAVVAALGLESPVLLGWSMGVMVAYEYLTLVHDQGVAGLIIVEQGPSDFNSPDNPDGVFTAQELANTNILLQTDQAVLAREFVDLMLHDTDQATGRWMVEEMCKCPQAIAGSILLDQTLRDYRAKIATLVLPTLVIFGEDPKLMNPIAGKWISDHIPGSRFEVIGSSSHCPFYEQADEFNALVTQFISSLAPVSSS